MRDHGSSLTVQKAPVDGGLTPGQTDPAAAAAAAATPAVKQEGESSQKPSTPQKKKPPTKTKVKREDNDDEFDSPDGLDGEGEERIDLAELNFPGGPVSSSRKNDRTVRGWKKIELWIEQEDAEQIILDDEPPPPPPPPPAPEKVTIKVEDDESMDIVLPVSEPIVLDDEDVERKVEVVPKNRVRRRPQRKSMKGKSREEKEEMAREELDLEVLKEQFLSEDGSEVYFLSREGLANLTERTEVIFTSITHKPTSSERYSRDRSERGSQSGRFGGRCTSYHYCSSTTLWEDRTTSCSCFWKNSVILRWY
jgi:hypothetical protein